MGCGSNILVTHEPWFRAEEPEEQGKYRETTRSDQQRVATEQPESSHQWITSADDFYQTGQRYEELGQYEQALESYQQAFTLHRQPDNQFGVAATLASGWMRCTT